MNNIWNEMIKMQENMDKLFNNFFKNEPSFRNNLLENKTNNNQYLSNYVAPDSDIYEKDKEIIAEIDLPGIDKKDIKVNVNKDSIEVTAEKKHEEKEEDKKKGIYRFERSYNGFCRKFDLPKTIDPDNAKAEYKNGVLIIKMPKLEIEESKKKLLEIE